MSFKNVTKLADRFSAKLQKLAESHEDLLREKILKVVDSLYPFVADNNLETHDRHYELTIELMGTPHYLSDRPDLSETEFQKLIEVTANILKNNFKVLDLSFEKGQDKTVAVKAKLEK